MTAHLLLLANSVVSAAYFAITYAILAPLVRAGEVRRNRLGTATAAIFFSCAMGHGLHALHAGSLLPGPAGMGSMRYHWYEAAADLATAGVAVYYWSLRRTYGALMQGATLFEDLQHQQRMAELEHGEGLAAARAAAERERDAHAVMLKAVIANSQSLVYVKDIEGRYLLVNEPFERAFAVSADDLIGQTDEFLDPKMAPVWRANDLRAQSEEYKVEEWSNGPSGRTDYESVKFPLHDADGVVYAICGISLDVT